MEIKRVITIRDEIYIDGKSKKEVLENAAKYLKEGYKKEKDGWHFGTTGQEEDKHYWIRLSQICKL